MNFWELRGNPPDHPTTHISPKNTLNSVAYQANLKTNFISGGSGIGEG